MTTRKTAAENEAEARRLAEMEAQLQADREKMEEQIARIEAAQKSTTGPSEKGPEAKVGDDRPRKQYVLRLLDRHAHWLETAAAIERARRGLTTEEQWGPGHQLEKILRQAVTLDPTCQGMLDQYGYSGSGPRSKFNPTTGGWQG